MSGRKVITGLPLKRMIEALMYPALMKQWIQECNMPPEEVLGFPVKVTCGSLDFTVLGVVLDTKQGVVWIDVKADGPDMPA